MHYLSRQNNHAMESQLNSVFELNNASDSAISPEAGLLIGDLSDGIKGAKQLDILPNPAIGADEDVVDSIRRAIVTRLQRTKLMTAGEIALYLKIPRSEILKHLRILGDAGAVASVNQRGFRYYQLITTSFTIVRELVRMHEEQLAAESRTMCEPDTSYLDVPPRNQ